MTRSLSYVIRLVAVARTVEVSEAARGPIGSTGLGWVDVMSADRRMRLWGLVVERAGGGPVCVEYVCAVAMSAVGVDRAAVAVVLSASPRETMYASDPVAAEVEELALTLGEGPGVDALTGGPALVAALCAAVTAYLSIRFLMRFFETNRLTPFAIYCTVAGAALTIGFAVT